MLYNTKYTQQNHAITTTVTPQKNCRKSLYIRHFTPTPIDYQAVTDFEHSDITSYSYPSSDNHKKTCPNYANAGKFYTNILLILKETIDEKLSE